MCLIGCQGVFVNLNLCVCLVGCQGVFACVCVFFIGSQCLFISLSLSVSYWLPGCLC